MSIQGIPMRIANEMPAWRQGVVSSFSKSRQLFSYCMFSIAAYHSAAISIARGSFVVLRKNLFSVITQAGNVSRVALEQHRVSLPSRDHPRIYRYMKTTTPY